jgi:hypothetical protein
MAALFDATIGLRVRNSGYRALLRSWGQEISAQVATTDLASMVRAGFLAQLGKKRSTVYVADGPMTQIRARLTKGRQAIDTSTLFDPLPGSSAPELPFEQPPND